MRHSIKVLPQEEAKRSAIFARHGGIAATKAVQKEMSEFQFSASQLRYNKYKYDTSQGIKLPPPSNEKGQDLSISDAENLLRHLEVERERGRLSYVVLKHEIKNSTLHTIRKSDHNRMEAAAINLKVETFALNGASSSWSVDLPPSGETAVKSMLAPIYQELQVGQEIMLAVAWCRDDERRLFELYPEVLLFDVTFGTNREGRPLGMSCAFDQNMNTFIPVRVYMPSECQWVFQWIFESAIPALFPKDALDRMQLFLTDGDVKMYDAFDQCREKHYPNAIHGLCLHHLLQPLKKLTELRERGETSVEAMVNTFRCWILSWTSLGGPETDREFEHSVSGLRSWLRNWQTSVSAVLRHNAVVLDTFLTKNIMKHKRRWWFAGRGRVMTLNQRTTSALESQNRALKNKKGLSVAPNNALVDSFLTQMGQVTARMGEYRYQTSKAARETKLWVQSDTSAKLTTTAESLLCQVKTQANKYACCCYSCDGWDEAEDIGSSVQLPRFALKRLPSERFYCADCDSAAEKGRSWCQLHAKGSPITRFSRIRYVQVLRAEDEKYEIFCSCLFQPTYGIPCHHLVALMPAILPEHVSVRWHTDIAENYRRSNDATRRFNRLKNEKRVLISKNELRGMVSKARCRQEMYATDLPDSFWYNDCVVHQADWGTISPHEQDADDGDPTFHPKDCSLLRTEIGLSQSVQDDNGSGNTELPDENKISDLVALSDGVQRSSDYFFSTQSIHRSLCEMVRMVNTPAVEEMFIKEFALMRQRVTENIRSAHGKKRDFSGTIVSSNLPLDTRRTYKRIKSSSERSATSKEIERKNHPVKLSRDSIMRTAFCEANSF